MLAKVKYTTCAIQTFCAYLSAIAKIAKIGDFLSIFNNFVKYTDKI
jgi:hypothetical protein